MKKATTLFLLVFSFFVSISSLNAQQLEYKDIESNWSGSNWIPNARIIYSYDANGYLIIDLGLLWNGYTSSYDTARLNTYVNDASGKVLTITNPSYKYTNTYDANGNKITELEEQWSGGAWVPSHKTTNTYDVNGYLTNQLSQWGWNSGTNSWDYQSADTYTNNGSGSPTQIIDQQWNAGSWTDAGRTTIAYSGSNPTTYLYEQWTGSIWKLSSRDTYTYSGNNVTNVLNERWDVSNIWINDSQYSYTYDVNGNVVEEVDQVWNVGTGWANTWRTTNHYSTVTSLAKGTANALIFEAYPNPASDILQLNMGGKPGSFHLKIFSSEGILMREELLNTSPVNYDISELPNGIYYVNIINGENQQTKKLVKSVKN